MKLEKLVINNFLAITSATINLADRGLVLVEGVNSADTSAKSNGAGKSSIADALCWCWFGTTARGETGDDVVNNIAGKNCSVTSTIIDGAMVYTATRHRKHKTGKNSLTISAFDGFKTTDLTKGTDKLTQEVANQIIGASLEVFTGSIYAGQERMPDLPAMTDKNLKLLIEEAAGITALEAAHVQARQELVDAERHLTLSSSQLNVADLKLTSVSTHLKSLGDEDVKWRANQKLLIDALKTKLTTVSVPALTTLKAEVTALEALDLETQIAAIDAKIASIATERATEDALKDTLMRLTQTAIHRKVEITKSNQDVEKAKKALDDVAHKVGCPCDSCGRPLTEAELKAATEAAQKWLDTFTGAHGDLIKQAKDELEAQKRAKEALEAFQATMTDLTTENTSRAALSASLNVLIGKRKDLEALRKEIMDDKSKLTALAHQTSPFDPQILKTAAEEDAAKKDRDTAEKIYKAAQRNVDLCKDVVRVFGPAGVRARILDDVTPYLNAQTAKYLSILSDGNLTATWSTLTPDAKGNMKEKFSIDVENATGGKKFGLISGGEKRKVRIATALALQDLVATRATKPINIFIGDEIDDALDPAGLERLMVILEEKAKERGSVFIISHADLKDYCRNVITIEKTATGETKITESIA